MLRIHTATFGAFELDLTSGELRSTAKPGPNNKVLLREQVFQVLRIVLMFVSHYGRSRDHTQSFRVKPAWTRLDAIFPCSYVLENSLRKNGNQIRLTAQLILVKDQTQLWSHDYDYPAKDILESADSTHWPCDDVVKSVAQEIQLRVSPQQEAELARLNPVNPEAFDAYLQGYYYFQRNTDKDTDIANA